MQDFLAPLLPMSPAPQLHCSPCSPHPHILLSSSSAPLLPASRAPQLPGSPASQLLHLPGSLSPLLPGSPASPAQWSLWLSLTGMTQEHRSGRATAGSQWVLGAGCLCWAGSPVRAVGSAEQVRWGDVVPAVFLSPRVRAGKGSAWLALVPPVAVA